MTTEIVYALRQPIVRGALIGALAAFVQDLRSFRDRAEAGQPFRWSVAVSRWIEGAIVGAAAAAGITSIT